MPPQARVSDGELGEMIDYAIKQRSMYAPLTRYGIHATVSVERNRKWDEFMTSPPGAEDNVFSSPGSLIGNSDSNPSSILSEYRRASTAL